MVEIQKKKTFGTECQKISAFLVKPELDGSHTEEEVASHKSHMLPSSLYKCV